MIRTKLITGAIFRLVIFGFAFLYILRKYFDELGCLSNLKRNERLKTCGKEVIIIYIVYKNAFLKQVQEDHTMFYFDHLMW